MVDIVDRVRSAIEDAVSHDADGRLLVCRLEITGRTELHGQMLASKQHLLAEAQASALALGEETAWIERVVVATEPAVDAAVLQSREDALGELMRMLGDASGDPALRKELDADVGELARRLPHEIRAEADDPLLKAAIGGDYAQMIREVSGYLSALTTEEGS
jgi:hypothetical protein